MAGFRTVEFKGGAVRLLDQTLLPGRKRHISIRTADGMHEAIRMLRVRGAPAIGVAAAWGVYIETARCKPAGIRELRSQARRAADHLATSRPTAVNLFWALEEMMKAVDGIPDQASVREGLARMREAADAIQRDDEDRCASIIANGAPLLEGCAGLLTHCNAGALATAGDGTALGVVIEAARRSGATVFADETRPLLQGARLTAWELKSAGVDYRLICDSMAATVMQRGLVQAVVTGADRIAANGDSANKIGTMPLAICAGHFGIPFYIAAPLSTVDFELASGEGIPIEERGGDEVVNWGGVRTAPAGTKVFNPAFDVVPARLITGIITEAGVLRPPYRRALSQTRRKPRCARPARNATARS